MTLHFLGRAAITQVPTVEEQEQNQASYLKSDKLQAGDYVYRSPHAKQAFGKVDELTRQNEVFIVDSVRAFIRPTMYSLRTLKDQRVPGPGDSF